MTTGTLRPLPHQVTALTALARANALFDRYQLGSACGTGKTLTARWHAEACGADVIVVFLPSLALLAQTLGEWRRAADPEWPWEAIVVCSDKSTAPGAAERAEELGGAVDHVFWAKVRASVTTDPGRASALIRHARAAKRRFVVFSTYHSAPVVASAAKLAGGVVFDMMICDEAHNLAMRPAGSFRAVLDDRQVRARKRLFMTATRVITAGEDVLSMDDQEMFGPVAHKVTFAEGIGMGRLVDYRVLVIAEERADDGRPRRDQAGDLAVPGALLAAAAEHDLRTILSFHTFIKDAAAFARLLNNITLRNGRRVKARHVSTHNRGADRAATLAWLGEDTGGRQMRLVSSARCLAEGIDVPAADAVIFADPRKAVVRIIQAAGRALRAAPGKKIATIIVPVTLPEGADDSELLVSSFGNVWAVLRALRAHDERFADEIETAAAAAAARGSGGGGNPVGRVRFLLPADVKLDEGMLRLRMIEAVAADAEWERFYQAYCDWQQATGGGYMPFNTCWNNRRVGLWVRRQMVARREGRLPAARAARLQATPGWVWEQEDGHFRENLRRIAGLAASRPDGLTQPPRGPSIYAGLKEARRRLPLGEAAAGYRQLWRDGMLPGWQAALLDQQPGWDWAAGLPPRDVAMIQKLREFAEFEHHGNVPRDHVEDGLPLGLWCQDVRRRKALGMLHPALEEEIAAATPRTPKGQPTFPWYQLETQWHLGYDALRAFAAREGTAAVPPGHVETLTCGPVNLGAWCVRQRYARRRGELDAAWEKMLAAVPGWDWDPPGRRAEPGEKLDWLREDLHGRPYAIQAGCKCLKCQAAGRAGDRAALDRRRAAMMDALGGPVPAGPATRHVAGLECAGGKRGLIAEVSGVPLGVVRQVAVGAAEVIAAKHADALLAVTIDMLQSAERTRVGSRGRTFTMGAERIPVEPTRRLLADFKRRGFGANWVARELGYATTEIITPHQRTVTRRVAEQVAALHARAAGLVAPKAYATQKVPPLEEILEVRQLIRARDERLARAKPLAG